VTQATGTWPLTANWKASGGDTRTVPFGGGVGRIMKLGFQPVNRSAQFLCNGDDRSLTALGNLGWTFSITLVRSVFLRAIHP
jgi:hypothetical protein